MRCRLSQLHLPEIDSDVFVQSRSHNPHILTIAEAKPMNMRVHRDVFKELAKQRILPNHRECVRRCSVSERTFSAYFGITHAQCARLWNRLCHSAPAEMSEQRPEFILDALHFLKLHLPTEVNAAFAGRDPKTVRKRTWEMIEIMAGVDWVSAVFSLSFLQCANKTASNKDFPSHAS